MPMYDYKCTKCGIVFEELVFSSTVADDQIKCPKCSLNNTLEIQAGLKQHNIAIIILIPSPHFQ